MSILNFTPPGWELRKEQRDLLLEIESVWDASDIISITAPTAAGKSLIMYIVAQWAASKRMSSNILVPTNVLVKQMQDSFPDMTPMHKMAAYQCADMDMSCADVKETCGKLCRDCSYTQAKKAVKKSQVRVMNAYVYMAHRLYADVVMFDEGHTVLDMLSDKKDVKLWRSLYKFPDNLKLVSDLIEWMQTELDAQPNEKLSAALRAITKVRHGATLTYKRGINRGKDDLCLHIIPITARDVPPWMWPQERVRKLLFLSATINKQDLIELGLDHRRVAYLECGSPIDPANRPIVYEPSYNLGAQYVDMALPAVVRKINELLARHPEKGLIHLPYSLAARIRELVKDPRLIFHDKETKSWALNEFKSSPPEKGRVLVASGMYEGVDLPHELARWQMIGKVPYLSLGDQRVVAKSQENPHWYAWEAAKRLIQAVGRIVRAPDDYGITYIFDTNFSRLIDADVHRDVPLFPKFFKAALRDMRKHKH